MNDVKCPTCFGSGCVKVKATDEKCGNAEVFSIVGGDMEDMDKALQKLLSGVLEQDGRLSRVLEEIRDMLQKHNNEIIELWKKIGRQDAEITSLWSIINDIGRRSDE